MLLGSELLGLRLLLRTVFGLRIGFTGTTDFDYIFAVPGAIFLLVFCLQYARPTLVCLNKLGLGFNLISVFCFVLLNGYLSQHDTTAFPTTVWGLLLASTVVSSIFCFVPFRCFATNPNRIAVVPSTLLAFTIPIYMHLPYSYWVFFGNLTAGITKNVFDVFFPSYVLVSFTKHHHLSLRHSMHNVLIGQGCGGGEAIFLFGLVFCAFLGIHLRRISYTKVVLFAFGGMGLMLLTNVLRIVLLFWAGVFLRTFFGHALGSFFFRVVAHAHLGWVLYACALGAYFRLLSSYTRVALPTFSKRRQFSLPVVVVP